MPTSYRAGASLPGDLAIRAVGLGKQYRLGVARPGIQTAREALVAMLHAAVRRHERTDGRPTIWALRDVSFEIRHGDVVGIIGRNGAGKSTLLKVLSRITEPTEGYAEVVGRVGSLLEVGTGFHSELSGRENIYLSGAILGMKRAEIKARFDEIVAFAEIDKFVDTPVKHYSSGMYLRLAFAVAAHLEPDILIVDEVLAVGDVQFQKKCLGKMQDVSTREGRTVLFVSHNMEIVQRLCSRCLAFEEGRLVDQGDTIEVVERYLARWHDRARPEQWIDLSRVSRRGTGAARFVAIRYTSGNEDVGHHPYPDGPLECVLAIESDAARRVGSVAVALYSLSGIRLVNADSVLIGESIDLRPGRNLVRLVIPRLPLQAGVYRLGLWMSDPIGGQSRSAAYDVVESVFDFDVVAPTSDLALSPNALVTCPFRFVEVPAGAELAA